MNNKVTILNRTIKGNDALTELNPGDIVMVSYHLRNANVKDILMRTDSNTSPFISLASGGLWGNSLENYHFEKILGELKIEIQ